VLSGSSRHCRFNSRIPRYAGSTSRSQPPSAGPSRSNSHHSRTGSLRSFTKLHRRASSRANQSVKGLRLSRKEVLTVDAQRNLEGSLTVASSNSVNNTRSSPLIVSTSRAKLKRRPRVYKRGSVSESDDGRMDPAMSTLPPHAEKLTSRNKSRIVAPDCPSPSHSVYSLCTPTQQAPHFHEEAVATYSLPIILPADQEYECRVEWESEAEPEGDAAEKLWRKLEVECGMLSPSRVGEDVLSTPRRGRWKVKVVETPVVPLEDDQSEHSTDADEIWVTEELDDTNTANSKEEFVGVLREVEDLVPPIHSYTRLAAMIVKGERSGSISRSKLPVRRAGSRKVVHRDIKRALRGVWEDQAVLEAESWSKQMEMLNSRSTCASAMSRANSQWNLARSSSPPDVKPFNSFVCPPLQGPMGLGITMNRSVTLNSAAADSMIDFYLDRDECE
jgi:hypothetical protein